MWLRALFLSLSIPAPLSSLEQPLEVPQRKGCWSLWADSLKPRCQTDQQAGTKQSATHKGRDGTRRQKRRGKTGWEKGDTRVKKLDCKD